MWIRCKLSIMKKITLFYFLIIAFGTSYAQMSDIIVELKTDTTFEDFGFSIVKVMDERTSKNNIGFVSRGIGHNNTKVVLKDTSTAYLEQTINVLLPKKENNVQLVVIIRNIIVSENIGTMTQLGFCNTEIEFAIKKDTLLYSLGTFFSSISEKSNRVKYSHGQRVLLAIEDCIIQFSKTDWRNNEGKLTNNENNIKFDYKNLPPKGAYLNYNQMKRKTPFDNQDYEINLATKSKKITTYKINFKGLINPKLVQFVSDGKDLYVRTSQTHFIRSGSYGRYIYFQGRIPTTYGNINGRATANVISIQRDLIMGDVESLFFTALVHDTDSYSEVRINNKVIGVVIDTENGKVKFLSDMFLYRITKPYPLMLKEYRKSRRKPEDKRKVIVELNSKYK